MLRYKECGNRFVVEHGQLTFYSHQEQFKWNGLVLDTLNGVSLKETATKTMQTNVMILMCAINYWLV